MSNREDWFDVLVKKEVNNLNERFESLQGVVENEPEPEQKPKSKAKSKPKAKPAAKKPIQNFAPGS